MIDLELIRLLDTVKRRGTLAAAADELNKVPSALSYTIQKYEDELGYALLQRAGRGVQFTEAASHLYARGLPLLQQAGLLTEEASAIALGHEPRLRIAVEAWLTLEAITPALTQFYQRFPNIEIDVVEEALSGTWEALIERRVDIAVGAPTPKPQVSNIQTDIIGSLGGVFAVAPNHPLATWKDTSADIDLTKERWIMLRDSARSWVPREVLTFMPEERLTVGSMGDKIAAQAAGLGVGYLPVHLIKEQLQRGELVALPIADDRAKIDLLLAWRTDSRGFGLQLLRRCIAASLADTCFKPK